MRISVLVPSLNSGGFIQEAIQSALAQDPPPHQVLVQDGGSTDDTLKVLENFHDEVDVRSEPDRGQSEALNRAVARASGDVLVWLNADDLLAPGAFAAVLAAFEQNPGAEFVYGDFNIVDGKGQTLRQFRSSAYDPQRVFVHGCYIFSGAIFFRRELIERVGPFDESLQACMDFDYLMRIGRAKAVHVERTVARFRMSGQQKSTGIRSRFIRESHSIRWRSAGGSVRLRLLTLGLDVRDAVYWITQPLRMTRAWGVLRRTRQL